jgi:4-alpha-glucanotransferase
MEISISDELNSIINFSREEAMRTGSYGIAPDHLYLGIIRHRENVAVDTLRGLEINIDEMKEFIDSRILTNEHVPYSEIDKVTFSRGAQNILSFTILEATKVHCRNASSQHLLLALTRQGDSYGSTYLRDLGVEYGNVYRYLDNNDFLDGGADGYGREADNAPEEEAPQIRIRAVAEEQNDEPKLSPLQEFGYDITKAAREGRLDPLVGREDEIQRVIQILPINDTTISHTWMDSYPYNSISIYAFHPQYVDLRSLPPLKEEKMRDEFEQHRLALNALPQVDYEAVNSTKRAYLHQLYKEQGEKTLASADYKKFYQENEHWLLPYAAFSYLRDKNKTADFRVWSSHSIYNKEEVDMLLKDSHVSMAMGYYCYVQYLLHVQLLEARRYAREKGVVIKGDIPIGISRNSVEAWVEPHYFNMNGQAGAPPDAFSVNGQNWGFPTYNWETMAADGYQWWIRRFSKMAEYFDAYRIDHVLGFFRIWEIPQHSVHGLLGQFSPAMPMTPEEIEGYGLYFRKDIFTRPYIADGMLDTLFGRHADEVRRTYLIRQGDGTYELKPEFDTQRKVEAHFGGRTDSDSVWVRDGLYSLISNVLFIPDRKVPGTYHPRISAQNDFLYQSLGKSDQEAFNRLYEDYFYHRHNQFWYDVAMKKLPALTGATRMLVCAEDLGMVPTCVPWVMNDLHILTLEIQTMPKKYGIRFGHLEENPYPSVATIFTHDMPTLRGWWEEDQERAQQYFNEILQKDGTAPTVMPAWLCEEVVARHLYSPSMLCLVSWQDWLSMDEKLRYPDVNFERINIPSDPHNYWRYRMHMTLETLMQCNGLNQKIRSMIERSDR